MLDNRQTRHTDNVEVDELAAGGVVPARHLALVLTGVGHLHAADHEDELRPVLAHHGLDPGVEGGAQVVEGHQPGDGGGVAEPGDLQIYLLIFIITLNIACVSDYHNPSNNIY